MTYLLNGLYLLVILLISPWLVFRAITTGRYRRGLGAKLWGPGSIPALKGDQAKPVIWFHGVSVGEVHLLTGVVRAYRERCPEMQVVVSASTDTGLAEARKRFADLPVIAWPLDFSWAVKRTLKQVQPQIVVLAESELWPNFLAIAQKYRVPVVVINGRMSPRSLRRYTKIAGLARRLLFNRIACFAMQSAGYAQAMQKLGIPAERVHVTGNVKYDGVVFDKQNQKSQDLGRLLHRMPSDRVWVAGSTHAPEEEIVLRIFGRLRQRHPDLRLILVPRSADRFEEVAQMVEATGIPFVRRSRLQEPLAESTPIVLIDTIGELGAAWGLADIAFTGGSLNDKRGGQSMIEPAAFAVPLVFGPHTWNFRDAVAGLLQCGAALQIPDEASLEQAVERLLNSPAECQTMGDAGQKFVQAQQGATARTLDVIESVRQAKAGSSIGA